MDFSLSSSLVGSATLNSDKLALNLQFATDKTLTARKGPTPVFTRASTATFVGSNGLIQSAAINTARFDHDPITLACKGLLIEESRTNLALQSENHPSATWSKTGVTVASATNTAPNGSTTSNLVSEDSSTGLHRVFQSTAYVSGTSYAISVFLKYAGRQFVAITHPAVTANNLAIFDIQNGSISLSQSGITSSITAYPNGWYRCVVNGVAATTATQSHIIQGSTTGGTLTGSYTGLNGAAFYIYGSQVEAGAFPTSYIPTTTASVVRSVDVCSIASISSFYTGVGTILVGSQLSVISILNGVCGFFSGVNQITIGRGGSVVRASTNGNAPNLTINSGTLASTSFVKSAFAFNVNDAAFANNGTLSGTSTSVGIPSVTTFGIGTNGSQPTQSGTISEIKVFKKRLANAKLITLTA